MGEEPQAWLGTRLRRGLLGRSAVSGRLSAQALSAQTERAFTEYWLNDEGIEKKRASALSCLDTPAWDTRVRKMGFWGTLEGTRQGDKGTCSDKTVQN